MYAWSRRMEIGIKALDPAGCIDSGHQPLSRSLLVSGRAIDLTGQKKVPTDFRFERRMKLGWKNKIVFDRVCRTHDFGVLTSDDGANEFHLDIKWQTGRKAVHIKFIGFDSFWLQKNLVTLLFREFYNFVLD